MVPEGTFIFTALGPSSDSRYTKRDEYFTVTAVRFDELHRLHMYALTNLLSVDFLLSLVLG